MMEQPMAMAQWVYHLQSTGRYSFTRSQVESDTGRSFLGVQNALRRLKQQKIIVSPRRGFYVIVPPEYRSVGSPPANWFIDDLMRFLGQPYYVGLLSAAAVHGAAHQQPMVFQVITRKPIREMRAGRVAIRFYMNSLIERFPVVRMQTETGTMRVATPESTAFDLVRYPAAAGNLGNVATVLSELADRMEKRALVALAPIVNTTDVQRLGYLLDQLGYSDLATPLYEWLSSRHPRAVPLVPEERAEVEADGRWHILPNADLELET
jgi:predicted transcriptional regulator of viral defense system